MISEDSPKKISCIVLNNFTNDSRVLKTSRSLARNGYQVRVLALHEGSLDEVESVEGFEVRRVKLLSRSLPKKKLFHALMYIEFTLRVLFRFHDHDVYHCNDLHTLPVGVFLKLFSLGRKKIVYDAHEYETEANGVGSVEKKLRRVLEGILIRLANRTITVSDSIANEYARLYKIEKPELILNLPMLSSVGKHDVLRDNLDIPPSKTIYLYQGGLSSGRGIDILLEAFGQLESDSKVLVLMGYGPLQPLIESKAMESDNIFFHPAVPPDQIPIFSSSADVGIATIENTCLSYYYCLPNKLFEYLMAEIPVIVSNLPEMKKLVEQYNLGIVARENTAAGIQNAVSAMEHFDEVSFRNKIEQFKQLYNWETQEKKLLDLYRGLGIPARTN